MKDSYYMGIALKEANKAAQKGEIPVGAVIVKDEMIIAKAHNQRDRKKIVTKHAEIIAIEKANRKIKDWRLSGCKIYITLEPCKMCRGAIEQSRIDKIIYGAKCNINKATKQKIRQVADRNIIENCKLSLDEFFKELRIKK